jgi:hypothetical protein
VTELTPARPIIYSKEAVTGREHGEVIGRSDLTLVVRPVMLTRGGDARLGNRTQVRSCDRAHRSKAISLMSRAQKGNQ